VAGTSEIAPALHAYAEKSRVDWQVPGIALAVVADGQTVLQRGYGVPVVGRNATVNERTIFNLGSASKAFTTALIAQLDDEKKLTWDDPVSDHLPALRLPDYAPGVTLRDLAAHRTGWGAASYNFMGLGLKETLRRVQHLPQAAPIRSRLVYNNLGYSVLAEAAAAASGKSWTQLLTERFFQPLSMADTRIYGPELVKLPNLAAAHAVIDDTMQSIKPMALDAVAPAGGIYSSARDMAAWMKMLLAKGHAGGRQLITERSIGLMQHMHMPLPVSGIAKHWPSTHFYGYGLGWFVRDYRGLKVVEHGGNTAGQSAFVLLVPELKFGVAVMANADQSNAPTAIAYRALDLRIGGESRDLGEVLLAERTTRKPAAVAAKPSALASARYTGTYTSTLYGAVRISPTSSGLAIYVHKELRGTLIPVGNHSFEVVWDDPYIEHTGIYSPIRFELGSNGSPSRLVIENLSIPTPVFERRQ
jgi:CubicO group peptidase (beta-lactamase class C family)